MPASRYVQSAGRSYASPYPSAAVGAARKFVQGVGSALLLFAGAGAMTRSTPADQSQSALSSLASLDYSSFESLFHAFSNGALSGPLQIGLAVLLFIAAGRCAARFLGLAIAAVFITLYLQGVTVDDSVMFLERFASRLNAAAQAFLTAEVK